VLVLILWLALWLSSAAVSTESQSPALPDPPGRLIDVAGRKVHLLCTGAGSPTVVFEAGASSFAIDFSLVQADISRNYRSCSYDRIGHGWSDPRTDNDPEVAVVLHELLRAGGEKPPYILAGASRGGLYIRRYVDLYPDDVAGLVFIDPTHEDRLFTMLNGQPAAIATLTPEQMRSTMTPVAVVKIPRRAPQRGAPFDRLPSDLYKTRIALDERLIASMPESVPFEVVVQGAEAERAELARLREQRLQNPHVLGDRPLVILTRSVDTNAERVATYEEMAQLSTNGRHRVVPNAGHEIHLFEPAAVVAAVRDVVTAVEKKARLPG
jgi:pimeloyl-ACP methyl ester carboxylesterase